MRPYTLNFKDGEIFSKIKTDIIVIYNNIGFEYFLFCVYSKSSPYLTKEEPSLNAKIILSSQYQQLTYTFSSLFDLMRKKLPPIFFSCADSTDLFFHGPSENIFESAGDQVEK